MRRALAFKMVLDHKVAVGGSQKTYVEKKAIRGLIGAVKWHRFIPCHPNFRSVLIGKESSPRPFGIV